MYQSRSHLAQTFTTNKRAHPWYHCLLNGPLNVQNTYLGLGLAHQNKKSLAYVPLTVLARHIHRASARRVIAQGRTLTHGERERDRIRFSVREKACWVTSVCLWESALHKSTIRSFGNSVGASYNIQVGVGVLVVEVLSVCSTWQWPACEVQ